MKSIKGSQPTQAISLRAETSSSRDFPTYSTCPYCGDQLYLSRMQYLCRDAAICGYSVSPQKHLPQLINEALAIGVSVFQAEVQPTPIDRRAFSPSVAGATPRLARKGAA